MSSAQSPTKRARVEEPPSVPPAIEATLKKQNQADVGKVNFEDYVVLLQSHFGEGSCVQDFGNRIWLVPKAILEGKDRQQFFSLGWPDLMPPKLKSVFSDDKYELPELDLKPRAELFTWIARTQLGGMLIGCSGI